MVWLKAPQYPLAQWHTTQWSHSQVQPMTHYTVIPLTGWADDTTQWSHSQVEPMTHNTEIPLTGGADDTQHSDLTHRLSQWHTTQWSHSQVEPHSDGICGHHDLAGVIGVVELGCLCQLGCCGQSGENVGNVWETCPCTPQQYCNMSVSTKMLETWMTDSWLIGNWIITSCQLHRAISEQSNSVTSKFTFQISCF